MTWEEHFKEDADKLPQEFLNKEITIEDCLKIIDGMAFTIKELFDKTKWHTGEPTEAGEYIVCIKYDLGKKYTTAYYVEPYSTHSGWFNLRPASGVNAEEWCKDHGIEVIAWQKIEPYKEHEE